MDLTHLKNSIKTVIQHVVKPLNPLCVIYANEPRPMAEPTYGGIIKIDFVGSRSIGSNEQRHSVSEDGLLELRGLTNRIFKISVKAECLQHVGSAFAYRWLEQIKTRAPWQSTKAILAQTNLVISMVYEVTPLPDFIDNDRAFSTANLDLDFAWTNEETEDDYDGAYIQTVEVSSSLQPDSFVIES